MDAAVPGARGDGRAGFPVSRQQRADERRLICGRRSRVVLTPRRWRQVLRRHIEPNRASVRYICKATVANKPGHRGERDISRKTIARGMPGVSGVTLVTNACAFYATHAAAGASSARHSLRPHLGEGFMHDSGVSRRGSDDSCLFAVIARSEATKQSILALPFHGLLRLRSQ
jgi:hypothetical protein